MRRDAGTTLKALGVAAFLGAPWAGYAQGGPDPREITIGGVIAGGTGCPQSTVSSLLSPDGRAVTLIFDAFTVEAGPNVPFGEGRKFCNIALDLRIPGGWQYSIFKVDYLGFAKLQALTKGFLRSTYRIAGSSGRTSQATFTTELRGSYDGPYEVNDDIDVESTVWSPCGINRALNIRTDLSVQAASGRRALLTVDMIEGEFKQIYRMQFRRCRG